MPQWGPRKGYRVLLLMLGGLVLVHATNEWVLDRAYYPVTKAFYFGWAENVPTWFSSVLLFCAALMALAVYRADGRSGSPPSRAWLVTAALLVVMSCDETAELHEVVGRSLAGIVVPGLAASWDNSPWPLVLGPPILALGLSLAWVLRSRLRGSPRAGRILLMGAGALVGASVGVEILLNFIDPVRQEGLLKIQVTVEETGEMLGMWLIGWGLVTHREFLLDSAGEAERRALEPDPARSRWEVPVRS